MLKTLLPLRKKEFRPLFISQLLNNCGYCLDFLVISTILVYSSNAGAGVLALFYVAYALPMIFSPFVGAYVDLLPLKKVMCLSTIFSSFFTFIIVFTPNITFMLIVVLVRAFIKSFYLPAEMSVIKLMFSDDELQQANSLAQAISEIFIIVSPLLGIFLLELMKPKPVLIITGILFFLSGIALAFLDNKFDRVHKKHKEISIRKITFDLLHTIKLLLQDDIIKFGFIALLFTSFFYLMSESMLVLFAKYLGFTNESFEWIFIFSGGGGLLGALIIGEKKSINFMTTILWGAFLTGISLIICSLICPFINYFSKTLFVISWFIIGIGISFVCIPYNIVLIKNASKEIIGKASSSVAICWGLSLLIAPSLGSFLVNRYNIIVPFAFGGIFLVLTTIVFWFLLNRKSN